MTVVSEVSANVSQPIGDAMDLDHQVCLSTPVVEVTDADGDIQMVDYLEEIPVGIRIDSDASSVSQGSSTEELEARQRGLAARSQEIFVPGYLSVPADAHAYGKIDTVKYTVEVKYNTDIKHSGAFCHVCSSPV